ncbi:zinc finger, CCHC-type containing protein [Tanacetum coccineum]
MAVAAMSVVFVITTHRPAWIEFYRWDKIMERDEALNKFKVFKTEVELQQESLIKRFRTDRGGEYMDTSYFQSVGIIHETTAPYTPQQNGIFEKKIKAVVRLPDPKLKTLGGRGMECIFVRYIEHSTTFSIPKGTEDIGGLVVPEEVIEEVVQQPESELRKSQRNRNPNNFRHEFQLYVIEETRDEGFKQKSRINYFDTYAPVARIGTIRLLIAMASIHNLVIHQMDVKTAFLNRDLDEEAHKQWHQKFDEMVLSNGYLLNQADKCVYRKFDESGKGVIICLYVNDMLIFGTDQVQVDLTKDFLSSRFSMKDMGEADVILGIRIKHESNGISISQSHYIEKVLKKFNYFDCTPVSTPMDTSEKLMPNNGQVISQLSNLG